MASSGSILVVGDDISNTPVVGMTVHVYQANSTVLATSGITDSSGLFGFLLPEASYDVFFYLQGASIVSGQPQRIIVDSLQSNNFKVIAHIPTSLESSDPMTCRISGYVYRADGTPLPDYKIYFVLINDPTVVGGNVIPTNSSFYVKSNSKGYMDFYLLRGGIYKAYIENNITLEGKFCSSELNISVPNSPGLDLYKILYPVPANFQFPSSTFSFTLISGPSNSIRPTITFSDGSVRTVMPAWAGLAISSSNSNIVTCSILGDGSLVLVPLSTGTAILTATRTINSAALLSSISSFVSGSLTVTVL